jgi:predicted NAD/FAD-dependent oxidoreductase
LTRHASFCRKDFDAQGSEGLRVGIVGAGICGLASARYLHHAGHEVVVFEKSRSLGGRVATRRDGEYVWDTGATSIAPRGKKIEKVLLQELSTEGLIRIEKPINVHVGLRVRPGHTGGAARYTYEKGNTTFAKRLAEGIDIRLEQQVDEIEMLGKRYRILNEEFDALILTPPVPQTSLLLWHLGESRPVGNVRYRPCLSVLLGYDVALPDTNYHALLDTEQMHPLTWLCLESVKSPGRAPVGGSALGAQLSAAYSLSHFETPDETLVQTVVGYMEWLYGPKFQTPVAWSVKRWKYSQPESFASFEHVNQKGSRLLVASDALLGGHVEDAFEVGTRTAELLVEES